VSETVSTAIRNGMNCRLSSIPGMVTVMAGLDPAIHVFDLG
jgi:hypothetical protein